MKKTILPLIIVFGNLFVNAQCVPGAQQAPQNSYIIPDSATNFVHGCQGNAYEQIMYIKAAKDTVISIAGLGTITADIDSFVVNANIGGMPAYLTAESVPALLPAAGPGSPKSYLSRLVIKGDSLACVRIFGNVPIGAAIGTNMLTVGLRVYTSNIHSADLVIDAIIPSIYPGRKTDTLTNLGYYKIVIDPFPCWAVGVNNLTKYDFDIISTTPNPAANQTRVAFMSNNAGNFEYKLVNSLGEIVRSEKISATSGINYLDVDVHTVSNGTYMFSLSNGKNLLSQKIQVNK